MNEVIDLNEMPAMFGMCNVKECALAEICLRQIVYPAVAKKKGSVPQYAEPRMAGGAKGHVQTLLEERKGAPCLWLHHHPQCHPKRKGGQLPSIPHLAYGTKALLSDTQGRGDAYRSRSTTDCQTGQPSGRGVGGILRPL